MDTSTGGWPKERDCFCHSKFLGASITFENNTVFISDKNTNSRNSNFRIAGKVAIVTGVASGIGATTVNLLHENGAKVVIADIQDTLSRYTTLGDGSIFYLFNKKDFFLDWWK